MLLNDVQPRSSLPEYDVYNVTSVHFTHKIYEFSNIAPEMTIHYF